MMIIDPFRFGSLPVGGTFLDANETNADITISGGNLIATKNANLGGFPYAIGTYAKTTGKWRYRVTVGANVTGGTTECSVGLVGPLYGRTTYLGGTVHSIGYSTRTGQIFHNNSAVRTVTNFSTGDVIDVLLDADLGKFWFVKNGTVQGGGDPELNTGGDTVNSGFRSGFMPALFMVDASIVLTVNNTGPWGDFPSFDAWDNTVTADRDTFRSAMIYIRSAGFFSHAAAEFAISTTSLGANVLAGGTVTGTMATTAGAPANLVDGNSTTFFAMGNTSFSVQDNGAFIVDIGADATRNARFLRIQGRDGGGGSEAQAPTLFDLYLSDDSPANGKWVKQRASLTTGAYAATTPGDIEEVSIPAIPA